MRNILNKIADTASSYEDVMNKIKNQTPDGELVSHPENLINVFLYIGGIVAIAMIVFAGVQMTTSGGDPGAVKKAKSTLMWSVVGLAVMILAYAIVNFVIFRVVD